MCARARVRENIKNSGDSGDRIYKSMFIKIIVIKNRYFRVGTEWGQSGDRVGTEWGQSGDRLKMGLEQQKGVGLGLFGLNF